MSAVASPSMSELLRADAANRKAAALADYRSLVISETESPDDFKKLQSALTELGLTDGHYDADRAVAARVRELQSRIPADAELAELNSKITPMHAAAVEAQRDCDAKWKAYDAAKHLAAHRSGISENNNRQITKMRLQNPRVFNMP